MRVFWSLSSDFFARDFPKARVAEKLPKVSGARAFFFLSLLAHAVFVQCWVGKWRGCVSVYCLAR